MTTNTRSALAGASLGAALLFSACGSPGADVDDAWTAAVDRLEPVPTMPATSLLEVSTTTVSLDAARSGFVSDVAAATPILGGLSEDDLGCVADRLLVELEPTEVVTLTRNGPRPDQAGLAVTALRDCDLVLHVVGLGIDQSLALDPDAPPLEPECLLDGVTADDLMLSVQEEFKENEDLPNTTNPDDWARISGRKGERIINVRTLKLFYSRGSVRGLVVDMGEHWIEIKEVKEPLERFTEDFACALFLDI